MSEAALTAVAGAAIAIITFFLGAYYGGKLARGQDVAAAREDIRRLEFMFEYEAVLASKIVANNRTVYQLVARDEGGGYTTLSQGDKWFLGPREAVDPAYINSRSNK